MSDSHTDISQGLRLVIAGTGGQGALTVARVLADFFVDRGHHVVSGQVHGMAQRGGAVQSSIMVDAGTSPVIRAGDADVIMGLEPVETTRALPFISQKTKVFINTIPIVPYVLSQSYVHKTSDGKYPEIETLLDTLRSATEHIFPLEATTMAIRAGSEKVLNMVMLGYLFSSGCLQYSPEDFIDSLLSKSPERFRQSNTTAFISGVDYQKFLSKPEVVQ